MEINMSVIMSEWRRSMTFTENSTKDFVALDTIVDGAPLNHEKKTPYVGDTTLAGLVRSIPRNSIKDVPIFAVAVNGTKHSIPSYVASFLLRRNVFNQDTFGKGFLATLQLGAQEALTHGYAPFMTALSTMFDEFGTTMKLLHYSNVGLEAGINDSNESGYWYVQADITKSRLQKIRDAAVNNPDTTWVVEQLDALLAMEPAGSDMEQYLSPAQRSSVGYEKGNTYKMVTRLEVGRDSNFITFCPQLEESHLRVMPNKSKFGYPRVQLLVIDPAPLSPFGLSRVRLASPNQNLMNAYYGNVASMFIINSAPPIFTKGRFAEPPELRQRARWEAIDDNAEVKLMELSNSTLEQFVPMASQMAAQIQNIMGVPQGNAGGGSNSMGYSRTAPGVKMQQAALDSSTNQIVNILENFARQYGLVALDTLLAEQSGEVDLILDDEAKNAINRLVEQEFVPKIDPMDPTGMTMTQFVPPIGADNKFTINWEEFYAAIEDWTIEIELSMGKEEMEEKTRADLQDTLVTLLQNDDGTDPEMKQKAKEIMDMILEKSIPSSKRLGSAPTPTPAAPMLEPGAVAPPVPVQ